MRKRPTISGLVFVLALFALTELFAAETPVIPIGFDAYRQWERWPYQRIGARAYMRSTYDRRGGNEAADASHFLYQLRDDFNVTLDAAGPGVLYFARYNHWHGSPWHYEVDGVDHIIRETATADPVNAKKTLQQTVFIPEHLFPNPLTWTWSTTKGADLMWVPLPFEKSFRMAYSRTRYGTGYYIYHLYDTSAALSQPIRSWDAATAPPGDVLELINRAGTDIAPRPGTPEGDSCGIKEMSGKMAISAGQSVEFARVDAGSRMLRAIEFSVPKSEAIEFGRARLRVTWDGGKAPSIDAPVALFFGAGTLYNRDEREYLVKGFPMFIRYDTNRVHLACFFPMPFFKTARFELAAGTNALTDVQWKLRHQPLEAPASHLAYFHATYRDIPQPTPGEDMVLLDTRGAEGDSEWAGQFVGMSWIFSHRGVLTTLEGDPRFFFDDSQSPQAQGTGTEEWGGGGDYWGGLNMMLPFAGHPCGARDARSAKNAEDLIESAYRFLLGDLMPFGRRAIISLEHGGENLSTEHYESVVYWYGSPSPTLVQTDAIAIGDPASERSHRYDSPQASPPYEITSRYEWGVDTIPAAVGKQDTDKPKANPVDYAEFEFEAQPGTYYIWVLGKNVDGQMTSDAFWLQFDGEIGTDQLGPGYNHPKGFGNWLDRFPAKSYAWSSALPQDPPQTITFRTPGKHRVRLQPRHPGHVVDRIWLTPTQKVLPAATFRPKTREGEVLLAASDANRMQGRVKRIQDPASDAGSVLEIGGSQSAGQREVYAPQTAIGRKTRGTSEFSLKLREDNFGVLLRRKLDYAFPNQRAEVFVAEESGGKVGEFQRAGTWYLAGGNTCIYSNPPEELGATQHNVQTSNRRFRDDEFIIPRKLTRGQTNIRVRVQFVPVEIPLFPGHPLAELAWSEIAYTAYCWVLPER